MKTSLGYGHLFGVLWIFIFWRYTEYAAAFGAKCRDVIILLDRDEFGNESSVPTTVAAYSSYYNSSSDYNSTLPFQGTICASNYSESWDTARRVCQYNSSHLLSLNTFNLNYDDIRPIIGNTELLHIGMRKKYGTFIWTGLKPEMFHTGINQNEWGWHWHNDEPKGGNCVAINVTAGKLVTVSCSDRLLNFICAGIVGLDMTSKLCPDGWKYSPFSKLCLRQFSVDLSHMDGVRTCKMLSGRLMTTEAYHASFPAIRYESNSFPEHSGVWLNMTDIGNDTCYYGERNSDKSVVQKKICNSLLGVICEKDPSAVDIEVKLIKSSMFIHASPHTTLICEANINGNKKYKFNRYFWWKNEDILRVSGYSMILGYHFGVENLYEEQGKYWCEVIIPGYPDPVASLTEEFYYKGVSTILVVIEGSGIPYDPVRYDRSKPDFGEKFLTVIDKKFSEIFTNFSKILPHLPQPDWQLVNASKTGNFTILKINIFLNHEGRKRPANEKEEIFRPVWRFLSGKFRTGITEWKLRKYDIENIGLCFTEISRTSIGEVIWNQTYHPNHIGSRPMCLNVDWKILTRSCNGGYGVGSKWSSFDEDQCVRFNKILENPNHHHCQPGYQHWNYSTCIRIYSNGASWSEAANECGRSLGFLFTPSIVNRSASISDNFNSTFKIFENLGEIWLGGHRENGIFQWNAFEPRPVGLDESTVVEWDEKYDHTADCVSGIIRNGKIFVQGKHCEEKKPYVCMHKNPKGQLYPFADCRDNWYGSPWLNSCYLINDKYFTWTEALSYCQSYMPDGSLAVFTSPEENDLLKNHLLNHFKISKIGSWWIGLQRFKNTFLWLTNGSEITYVDWYQDAQNNIPGSAVALQMKASNVGLLKMKVSVGWVQLNQSTKLPSICQTGITRGTTWCKVAVEKNISKVTYKCQSGHAVYGSITWYKDGVAVSGNRGLIEAGAEVFSPSDLIKNSVLPLKNVYQLQGYYWCEVQQGDPFQSVASSKVLFTDLNSWTFVGRFIATKIKGHYDIGQRKFWNITEEIDKSLKGIILTDPSLIKDVYITDLLKTDEGNEVKFYIYSPSAELNYSRKKQHMEKIKQYVLQQLKNSGRSLVERYGIIPEKISVMNTDVCFSEETIISGKTLNWEPTSAGKSSLPDQNCINENGYPVVRRCHGNFTHGVYWGPVDGVCSERQSNVTLSLKTLSEEQLKHSNMRNTSLTLENLTRNSDELIGIDIHYVATTLENIAEQKKYSAMAVDEVAATVNNIMEVQQEIIEGAQRKINASLRIVASLETILEDSKQMNSITKPNIAVMSSPLKHNDVLKIVGLISRDKNPDGFQMGDVTVIDNNSTIPYSKISAGIWLPLDLVEEKVGPSSYINFILYRNATLFATSYPERSSAIVSPVISAFFSGDGESVQLFHPRIKLVFKTWQADKQLPGTARCVYWEQSMNGKQGDWSTTGCTKPQLQSGRTVCYCDHLTSFAVLVDLYGDGSNSIEDSPHGVALDIITYVGCTLSIFGLLFTIITFALFRKLRNGLGSQVLCNLSVSLLLSLIVFMAGINQTHWKPGCMIVAGLLHYLLMVAFSWMLVEAVLQYLRLVKVIGTYIPRFILKSALCAWGIPLLVVVIILAVDYELYHSKRNYCWIHIKAFYYGFLLPVALVMICNIVIFILIIHSITCGRQKGLRTNQDERKLAIARLRAACCILFLLGLSWSFGFLAISDARLVFKYLFSIFTTLQGFFIFLFHVVQEKTTRNLWYNYIFHKKDSQVQTFTTRDTSMFVKDATASRNQ